MLQLLIGELFYSVSQPYDLKIGPKLVLNLVNPQLSDLRGMSSIRREL